MHAPLDREAAVTPGIVAAAVAVNALEFYDFLAYGYFAIYIGRAFFPAGSAYASLMASIAVFGVGFIFRPLGGWLIGRLGDRSGRRPAMLLSLALASAGTLGIAITPDFSHIGRGAPAMILLCRAVQGLALGGGVGPATAFLLEVAPPGRRALYGSLQSASQFAGGIAASGIGLAVSLALPAASLAAWGWRVPFAAAILFLPLLLRLRRVLPETAGAGGAGGAGSVPRRPPPARQLAAAALLIVSGTISIYIGIYLPTYALATLHLPPDAAFAAGTAGAGAAIVTAVAGGWLGDRYGRRPVLLLSRLALAAAALPVFALARAWPGGATLILADVVVSGLAALGSASFALIPELLPRAVRAGGFSLLYAVSVAVFGGTTQLAVTWVMHVTGDLLAPAWYLAGACLLGAAAVGGLPETRGWRLD